MARVKLPIQTFEDAKEAIVDVVFSYIDRMNDICEGDPAEKIVMEFTAAMDVVLDQYFELQSPTEHCRRQRWLEFRSPEQLAEDERKREATRRRLRPRNQRM